MDRKKDLVIPEEIDRCLRYIYNNNKNNSAQEQLLKLLQETQITLEEPKVEDSIDGTRICFTYATVISRKRGGVDEGVIRFQYMKEIPVDYGKVPIRLRDNTATGADASAVDNTTSPKLDAIVEDTIIESYDELEKGIPTLYEVLGHLKRIYFMPEDFSNRLVVDRIHKLRNMFSKDEILTLPSIDLSNKAGLIPI
ncbi:MAG: hypothetical protein M3278_01130 [Thermoproteota archaeon]|jgi:hypothetical protein|nr:hypothetical protein [Thermoproteota archaeon]